MMRGPSPLTPLRMKLASGRWKELAAETVFRAAQEDPGTLNCRNPWKLVKRCSRRVAATDLTADHFAFHRTPAWLWCFTEGLVTHFAARSSTEGTDCRRKNNRSSVREFHRLRQNVSPPAWGDVFKSNNLKYNSCLDSAESVFGIQLFSAEFVPFSKCLSHSADFCYDFQFVDIFQIFTFIHEYFPHRNTLSSLKT